MNKLTKTWLLSLGLIIASMVFLSTSATAALANVSHAYLAEGQISSGYLVSLDPQKTGYVEASNTSNGSSLLGVAVNPKDSLLAVNPSNNSVQIATTGTVTALVSTVNGNISVGDMVSISPFNGIGMKAEPGLNIIGLAQTSLNSKTPGVTKEKVTNKSGKPTTLLVGYVSLTINITTDNQLTNSSNLNGLQKLVKNLTGHVISTFRIIISLIIILVTFLALIIVTYSAIFGSIVSVGRNPLAKHAIFGTLRSVLVMTILVALVAIIMVYLLLS
jgi:hypothetical protein